MKSKIWTFSGLVLLLGILGVCSARSAAAQAAVTPFVTTVAVNPLTNFNYTPVAIPSGMRLVVDYISMSGAAQTAHGPIQPIVILNTQLAGGPQNLFYFAPPGTPRQPSQFYMGKQTTIYADTLSVGPGFSGYAPTFFAFSVVISGHLVPIPPPANPPAPSVTSEVNRETPAMMGITAPPER